MNEEIELAEDLPYYIDDPLVDHRRQHKLEMVQDHEVSARVGRPQFFGVCACGDMVTKVWDDYAVMEEYEIHMGQVQQAVHDAAKAARAGEDDVSAAGA